MQYKDSFNQLDQEIPERLKDAWEHIKGHIVDQNARIHHLIVERDQFKEEILHLKGSIR